MKLAWIGCMLLAVVSAHQALAQSPEPYRRSGVVNCSLPGTIIEFALTGSGQARLARVNSNYPPFAREARRASVWRASTLDRDGTRILILDNGFKTRIMVTLESSAKGIAYSADGGVSDILCQVLVDP